MFTVRTRAPDSLARTGTLHLGARRRRHAGVRAAGDQGRGQDARAARRRRARLRDDPRQHVPPAARPGAGARPRVRRPPRVHALGPADHHRLGRLSGVLDGPRWRGRRDQGRGRGGGAGAGGASARSDGTTGRSCRSTRRACASAPTSTARERFLVPETSMAVQAALGSDIALVFDECTPFHVSREYTARSMERTHRWLERCLRWHAEHGPAGQVVYGIVQGGVEQDLRLVSAAAVAGSGCDGIAIGGSLGQDKAQMHEVVSWTTAELERLAPDRPRHLLGIGDVDDLIAGVELGIDTFDCALPTRLGRHGVALVPDPDGPVARRPGQGPLARIARADPRRLSLSGVLGRVLAGVSALPAARRRADRAAARHPPQPVVHRPADGRPAGRDRRRAAGGGGGRTAGRRAAGHGCLRYRDPGRTGHMAPRMPPKAAQQTHPLAISCAGACPTRVPRAQYGGRAARGGAARASDADAYRSPRAGPRGGRHRSLTSCTG